MTDTTHKCPAPGCSCRVPRSQFACADHWYALPQQMRETINTAYRVRRADHGRSHMMAMLDAKNHLKAQFTKEQ